MDGIIPGLGKSGTSAYGLNASNGKLAELTAKAASGGGSKEAQHAKLKELSEQFEQIFLQTMLGTMMEGTSPEAPFNGGAGEEQFKGFLTTEYAGAVASNGGIGLADSIYEDLLALQEGSDPTTLEKAQ